MYKCNNCAHEFQHYDTIKENTGEKHYVCPRCRGTDFDEAKVCENCDELYTDSLYNGVCPKCIAEVEERFSKLLNDNFSEFELSILNSVYDGRNLG